MVNKNLSDLCAILHGKKDSINIIVSNSLDVFKDYEKELRQEFGLAEKEALGKIKFKSSKNPRSLNRI